jgi:hypothetical protein
MTRSGRWAIPAILLFSVAGPAMSQTAAIRFDGRPEFREGKALGYFIWRDGDTWKLRWTTFGSEHRFSGRVVLEGGEFRSFKRVDVDEERKVIRPGAPPRVIRGPAGRVRSVRGGRAPVVAERTEDLIEQEDERTLQWRTETNDDVDGLDFKVTDATVVIRFNLMIDGEAKPAEVEVGKANFRPNENPIRVRLRP